MDEKVTLSEAAWKAHKARFACDHSQTELRTRVIKNGGAHYTYQCQRCGDAMRQPLAKAKALELSGGAEPPAFDIALQEDWKRRRDEDGRSLLATERQEFRVDYDAYIASEAWAAKRKLVLKRSGGQCEGCGLRTADEVHHLTYQHFGEELLFELVAVCSGCHDRLHPDRVVTS